MERATQSRHSYGGLGRARGWAVNLFVTLALWGYFTAGFVLFFSPFYLLAALFAPQRIRRFRSLNSRFYRGFFGLARLLMPGWKWRIDPRVRTLAGSLIVCNHVSYLDSILLISLFKAHTTIAKARLFRIPIFGRMLQASGYLPSRAEGGLAGIMVERLEALPNELAAGTNLIVFPEGTRSRNGQVGEFHTSVFKIAHRLDRPLQVLVAKGGDGLFQPGRFLFNASGRGTVAVDWVGAVAPPAAAGSKVAVSEMMAATRRLLEDHLQGDNEAKTTNGPRGTRECL
jgi:1-acyl-sn-glycerol-3-phosphate acyltransferase